MGKQREHTCLHADASGLVWGMLAQGKGQPVQSSELEEVLRSGTYRIIGVPDNYRLITELYNSLIQRNLRSKIWIGSPEICPHRNCTPRQLLSCLSVLGVHDNLHHRWHALTSKTYNNYLLLRAFREEGLSDLTQHIYSSHCLRPFFDFLGLYDAQRAVSLIAQIVDPRWFLNPRRPHRMSRLESYFGLLPTQFSRRSSAPQQQRFQSLQAVLSALSPTSFLRQEVPQGLDTESGQLRGCRLLLGFLARNWLAKLIPLEHFDPDRFFSHSAGRAEYNRLFKD